MHLNLAKNVLLIFFSSLGTTAIAKICITARIQFTLNAACLFGLAAILGIAGAGRGFAAEILKEGHVTAPNAFEKIQILVATSEVVDPGDRTAIEIRLENNSNKEIWIRNHRDLRSLKINLSTDGIEAERTKQGNKTLRPKGATRGSLLKEIVRPSGVVVWKVDLDEMFIMHEGRYNLVIGTRVEIEGEKPVGATIESGTLVFNVTKKHE